MSRTLLPLLLLVPTLATAQPLEVEDTGFPDILCVFYPGCTAPATDYPAPFAVPDTTGDAYLRSRVLPYADPGTQGEGLRPYAFEVDLREVMEDGPPVGACAVSLTVTAGPIVPLDYNGDGQASDVFVGITGSQGTIGLVSATRTGDDVTFVFDQPVCGGDGAEGEATVYFGFASPLDWAPGTSQVELSDASVVTLDSYGPDLSGDEFQRGDCTDDGLFNLADAVRILSVLFIPGTTMPGCADACDANDNGVLGLPDPLNMLNTLFAGGGPLPSPSAGCGVDPTSDPLDCAVFLACP